MTLDELDGRLREWHQKKYPGGVDLQRTLIKAGEEYGEICRAFVREDWEGVVEEIADVVFTLHHLARGLGTTVAAAVARKLPVIEKRLRERKK